jgi:hypothetical protein
MRYRCEFPRGVGTLLDATVGLALSRSSSTRPVRRYVPEFRLAGDAADRVILRHVLQHASGLPLNTAGGPILTSSANGTLEQGIAELRGREPSSVLDGLVVQRATGPSLPLDGERGVPPSAELAARP